VWYRFALAATTRRPTSHRLLTLYGPSLIGSLRTERLSNPEVFLRSNMPAATHTPLSRQRILAAALRLVDEQGLDALSMRKLAASLGVEAMSLYTHVPSKSALLTGVLELLVAQLEVPQDEDLPWVERLRTGARSFRRVAHEHPAFVRLLTSQQEYTEVLLHPTESGLAILRGAGLGPTEAAFAYQTLMGYLLGALQQEEAGVVGVTCGDLGVAVSACDALPSASMFDLPRDHFPYLLDTLQRNVPNNKDAAFEFGLDLILASLERLASLAAARRRIAELETELALYRQAQPAVGADGCRKAVPNRVHDRR